MSDTHPPRQLGKSFLALLAGMLAGIVLSIGTDVLLHVIGLFPPLGQPVSSPLLLLATAYRSVYGVIGSYIAARLAPSQPMMHALVLGMVGFVVQHCRRGCDVEQGTGLRSPLVSRGAHRARHTNGLGRREAARDADGARLVGGRRLGAPSYPCF